MTRPCLGFPIMVRRHRQPVDFVTCRHCQKRFRAITFLHLRNIHGYEGDHPILDYKAEFDLDYAICRRSRQKISTAKEAYWDERGQHWTRADVLAEIRRLHQAGECLRRRDVPVRLYEVGRRLFGTWEAAVEQAGLNYEEASDVRRWDREKVIERIRALADEGEPLHATHIKEHDFGLYRAAVKLFPASWNRALRAAGFDPDEHKLPRGHWDETKAQEWVRQRESEGQSVLARDVPRDLLDYVHKRLQQPWTDFVESLDIPYPGIKKRRDWTQATLLSEIRRWQADGHPLNYRAVKDDYQALIHQARKFYGSWDAACAAAGVNRTGT